MPREQSLKHGDIPLVADEEDIIKVIRSYQKISNRSSAFRKADLPRTSYESPEPPKLCLGKVVNGDSIMLSNFNRSQPKPNLQNKTQRILNEPSLTQPSVEQPSMNQ